MLLKMNANFSSHYCLPKNGFRAVWLDKPTFSLIFICGLGISYLNGSVDFETIPSKYDFVR